jgi:hypothetical protein
MSQIIFLFEIVVKGPAKTVKPADVRDENPWFLALYKIGLKQFPVR